MMWIEQDCLQLQLHIQVTGYMHHQTQTVGRGHHGGCGTQTWLQGMWATLSARGTRLSLSTNAAYMVLPAAAVHRGIRDTASSTTSFGQWPIIHVLEWRYTWIVTHNWPCSTWLCSSEGTCSQNRSVCRLDNYGNPQPAETLGCQPPTNCWRCWCHPLLVPTVKRRQAVYHYHSAARRRKQTYQRMRL